MQWGTTLWTVQPCLWKSCLFWQKKVMERIDQQFMDALKRLKDYWRWFYLYVLYFSNILDGILLLFLIPRKITIQKTLISCISTYGLQNHLPHLHCCFLHWLPACASLFQGRPLGCLSTFPCLSIYFPWQLSWPKLKCASCRQGMRGWLFPLFPCNILNTVSDCRETLQAGWVS